MRFIQVTDNTVVVNEYDSYRMETLKGAVQLQTSGMFCYLKTTNPKGYLSDFERAVREYQYYDITEFTPGKAPTDLGDASQTLGQPIEGVDALTQAQRAIAWCTRLSADQLLKLFVDWGKTPAVLVEGEIPAVINLGESVIVKIINSIKEPKYSKAQEHPDWEFIRSFIDVYKTADKTNLNPGYKVVWDAVDRKDYGTLIDLGENFLRFAKDTLTSRNPTRLERIL